MKKKCIGLIMYAAPGSGGIYQYAESMMDALSCNDKYRYVVFSENAEAFLSKKNIEFRKMPQISLMNMLFCLFVFFATRIRSRMMLPKHIRSLFADVDIFISPAIRFYPYFFMNKPFVATIHDLQERYYPDFFSLLRRLGRMINSSIVAKYSDAIICETKNVKRDIEKYLGVGSDKIHVISSPPPRIFMDSSVSDQDKMSVKRKYDLPERYLYYPAQFWTHKNHVTLIKALKLVLEICPDMNLVFSGAKKNEYRKLYALTEKLQLLKNVRFLGFVDYKDVPVIYSMSEMLVMPSLFESVSIPVYEAFSLMVPVCCSNVVGLPEQCAGAALLFDPLDEKDISNKVITVLTSKEVRNVLVRSGFERMKNYNHDRYSESLITMIDRIIEPESRAGFKSK